MHFLSQFLKSNIKGTHHEFPRAPPHPRSSDHPRRCSTTQNTARVLYVKATAFSKFPKPTIELQYQGVGPSGSQLDAQRRAQAEDVGRFSMLSLAVYITRDQAVYSRQRRSRNTFPSSIIHEVYCGIHTMVTG